MHAVKYTYVFGCYTNLDTPPTNFYPKLAAPRFGEGVRVVPNNPYFPARRSRQGAAPLYPPLIGASRVFQVLINRGLGLYPSITSRSRAARPPCV
jgi:hypothetical protein